MGINGDWHDEATLVITSAKNIYNNLAVLAYDHQEVVAIAATAAVVVAASLFAYDRRKKWLKKVRRIFNINRGKSMSRAEHLILQRLRAANIITDALEEAVFDGRLSQSYVNHVYKQLAHIFNDKAFRNRKVPKDKQVSKEEIQHILNTVFQRKPMKIPGPKPGEVDNVHVYEKVVKHKFGDKARRNRAE